MGVAKAAPEVCRTIVAFASAIGVAPIELGKEIPGKSSIRVWRRFSTMRSLCCWMGAPSRRPRTRHGGSRLVRCLSLPNARLFSLNTIYDIDAAQNEKQRRFCRFLNKSQIALP